MIYHTNLRALFEHAGNRLCTQAQFEWRSVFMQFMLALKDHSSNKRLPAMTQEIPSVMRMDDAWQWQLIAEPRPYSFTPICYRLGRCAFMSELDRGCTIRDRANAGQFDQIRPMEWLANPAAGITDNEHNQRPPAA